eukprot:gene20138-22111_t
MASNTSRALNIDISVEKMLEQEIEEISRTGEEKYKKPMTLSEELIDFAHKIDFLKEEEVILEDEHTDNNTPEKKTESSEAVKWPWESVRNKLRDALSEVGVLLDVLQVMKEKRYLVLEPVSQNPEPTKQVVQMIGKRKSLAKAAEVIKLGADRMSQGNESKSFNADFQPELQNTNFFTELMKLRQKWRIKKTGSTITGDLSYKSAGSMFWHPGLFEVKKTQDVPEEDRDDSSCPLSVRVSSDLEGYSRVKVEMVFSGKDDVQTEASPKASDSSSESSSNVSPWQRKLKQAQFNLFCKELFSQISREAFQSPNLDSVQVTGNIIKLPLADDAHANIIYEKGLKDKSQCYENVISGLGDVLEFRLQQKLHEQHRKNMDTPVPNPSTASWTTKENSPRDVHDFLAKRDINLKRHDQCLLESFSNELKHIVLRKRIMWLLDRLSMDYSDPYITTDWSSISGPTSSSATIQFISKRHRLAHKTSYHLTVGTDKLRVIDMDGTVAELHGQQEHLEKYIKTQVPIHFSKVALGVFEDFGWTILHYPSSLTTNKVNKLELTITARSAKTNCWMTLGISEDQEIAVYIQKTLAHSQNDNILSALDKKWSMLEGKKEEIDWKTLKGVTFVEKLFNLVASSS